MEQDNPILERLEEKIEWYQKYSRKNRIWYRRYKVIEIVAAAIIPFAAGLGAPSLFVGGLGVLIVVIEGLQNLYRFSDNWVLYRNALEDLRHEKYLYYAKSGPYTNIEDPEKLLATRVEWKIALEHAKWGELRREEFTEKKKSSN